MTVSLIGPDQMTATQARACTDRIKGALIVAYDLMVECWRGRADRALGYMSWDAYCAGEFAEARMVRLSRGQRQELVSSMRSEGMSTRAIGSALGSSEATVRRDIPSASNDADDTVATVTSLDGRERPANRPSPPIGQPMTAAQINAITPQHLIEQDKADQERALPAYGIAMAINDLLNEPAPEAVVEQCPPAHRDQFARVGEALTYLTRLNAALESRP